MKNKRKNNQSISQKAEQLIRNYQIFVISKKEEVLDTLLNKIEAKEQDIRKPGRKILWFKMAGISVAATVALFVSFWFFSVSKTVSTGVEETLAYRLPDGSRVVLHNESSITFNKNFGKNNVKLFGEAYFEVVKGEGFRVKTSQGGVEVLGTRFLVDVRDNMLKVLCFQGSVKAKFENNSWILEPGTQFVGQDKIPLIEKIEREAGYPEFAKFKKNFSNTPLSVVVNEIEEFFEVDISLEVPSGKNFSGNIRTGNLENILQIVCRPLQLNYRFEDEYRITIF